MSNKKKIKAHKPKPKQIIHGNKNSIPPQFKQNKPVNLQIPEELKKVINDAVDRAIKQHVFPLRFLVDNRYREQQNLEINQVAMQTILKDKGIVSLEEFQEIYTDVFENQFGVIDKDGKMKGTVTIEIYNLN